MDYIDEEITKYKKKATRTVQKSKHKHIYKDCLFYEKKKNNYLIGGYCLECGKVGNVKLFDSTPSELGYSRMLSQEELLEKYKDYEIKEIDDIFKDRVV